MCNSVCLSHFLAESRWSRCCLGTAGFTTASPWRPWGEGHNLYSLECLSVWEKLRNGEAPHLLPLLFLLCTYFHLLPVLNRTLVIFLNQHLLSSLKVCSVKIPHPCSFLFNNRRSLMVWKFYFYLKTKENKTNEAQTGQERNRQRGTYVEWQAWKTRVKTAVLA